MLEAASLATEAPANGNHSAGRVERPRELVSNSAPSPPEARRNRLPDERPSTTHKFSVGSHEGYLTVGLYPNGQPGEIFVTMAKEGSTVSGLINSFAHAVSIGLQYGVPLRVFCEKFSFTRFEPSGWTGNPAIPQASSVCDYIFRWLQKKFLGGETIMGQDTTGQDTNSFLSVCPPPPQPSNLLPTSSAVSAAMAQPSDAPSCRTCGSLMRRNGSCYACSTCGWTSGCS